MVSWLLELGHQNWLSVCIIRRNLMIFLVLVCGVDNMLVL